MRIIAGQFRGRRLKGPKGLELRPTSDRLKETLFNILGPGVRNCTLLDVFAGTGAIGLEALSRGAREVVFIEQSKEGCRLIEHNLHLCGIARGYQLIPREALIALRHLGRQGFTSDFIFMDPPYRWESYSDLLAVVFSSGLAGDASRVIIEHHIKSALPEVGENWRRTRLVRQGDHCLSFYDFDSRANPVPTPDSTALPMAELHGTKDHLPG